MKLAQFTLTFYKDRKKQWRWRLTAKNNRKVANAGEGYRRKVDCVDMGIKLFDHLDPKIVGAG